tara:strand:+ start:2094 stop:2372 length:279 start_codon:yes stop_codon:yes gene_type:complete
VSYAELYPAIYPWEHKIVLLLGMQGYNKDNLQFRLSLNNERYLRYGYWEPVAEKDIDYLHKHCEIKIIERSWEEDEKGTVFSYDIKSNIKPL